MKKRAARGRAPLATLFDRGRRGPARDGGRTVTWSLLLRYGAGAAALVALGVTVRAAGSQIPGFAVWVADQGAWAPVLYVAGYAVLTVACVPGVLPTMAAGVVFGLLPGTIYAVAGEVLGGASAFWLARSIARPLVEARIARSLFFASLDRAVAYQGRRIVFLLRLSPAIPFGALNYGLGLSTIRFADYLVASIALFPGALLCVYYGKLIGDLAALAGGTEVPRDAVYWTATLLGVTATTAVTLALARIATQALRAARVTATTPLDAAADG